MKGVSFQIEEMIKLLAVMFVFLGLVLIIISATGGMNEVLDVFCQQNPSWCGVPPDCVCCEFTIQAKLGFPFDDIYSEEHLWTTEENCIEMIKAEGSGAMYWKEGDPNKDKCGLHPNRTIDGGVVVSDVCVIPEEYVGDTLPECVCCQYEPIQNEFYSIWDMEWRCEERERYNVVHPDVCGALFQLPEEAREQTLKRIGKLFGIGGEYCEIPFPYNFTESP